MQSNAQLTPKTIHYCPSKKSLSHNVQRLFLYLLLGVSLSACNVINANDTQTYNYPISPDRSNTQYMHIKLLGSIALKSTTVDSLPVYELSGIAWDEDEQRLYAVSDEGLLYHLAVHLDDGKLKDLKVVAASRLKGANKQPLKGKYADSEGLTLLNANNGKKGDSELIISFENKPRIARYSPKGDFISAVKTPKKIHKKKYFRHRNKALESVTIHPKYGILTAAERPLKENPLNTQTIYASSGKEWHFAASKVENSSVTGLEVLPNGDLMILERAYKNPLVPIDIKLRRLQLDKCDKNQHCPISTIARFNGADGWLLDNFEGIAHFKDNQYFMVSDNNKNPLQTTIFVLFEIQ